MHAALPVVGTVPRAPGECPLQLRQHVWWKIATRPAIVQRDSAPKEVIMRRSTFLVATVSSGEALFACRLMLPHTIAAPGATV
jgi:hypothetical protein